MKIYFNIFLIFTAVIISTVLKLSYSELFMNTLYTILGIMFSIGLGLVVTFNLSGIKNRNFIIRIRRNLKTIRTLYIINFSVSTIFYLLESQLRSSEINHMQIYKAKDYVIQFDVSTFTVILLLYSIVYCIVNLIELQKLSESIFDETNN